MKIKIEAKELVCWIFAFSIAMILFFNSLFLYQISREIHKDGNWFKCYSLPEHRRIIQNYADILKEQKENDLPE